MTPGMKPLRFQLYVPRLQLGPVTLDPLRTALGTTWEEVLRPVLADRSQVETLPHGTFTRYPLSFASGIGFHLSLQTFGELALFNDNGQLKVTVPLLLSQALTPYQQYLRRGPQPEPVKNGMGVCSYWYELPPGARFAMQIPVLGEVSLVAE